MDADKRKRGNVDPTTCNRIYSTDEFEFIAAMAEYKRHTHRNFPSWSEALEVLRSLGYRKVAEPTALPTKHRQAGAS